MLSKFANDIRLVGGANLSETHTASQRGFGRMEKWTNRNLTEFSKRKHKVLHLGRNNSRHWKSQKAAWQKRTAVSFCHRLNMNQECVLVAKKANGMLGCLSMSDARRLKGRWSCPYTQHCAATPKSCFQFWGSQYKPWTKQRQSSKGPWRWWQRGWNIPLWIKAERSETV